MKHRLLLRKKLYTYTTNNIDVHDVDDSWSMQFLNLIGCALKKLW